MHLLASATAASDSFASAFLVMRNYHADGTRSIEWIGTLIVWFLVALSIVNVGLIGFLSMSITRRSIAPAGLMIELKRLCDQQRYLEALEISARDGSFFSRVLHAGLKEASISVTMALRRAEAVADELTVQMLRRVEYLNVLGQVSPMIGLFGTVYGIILAFRAVVLAGGNPDPTLLAAGIGTALVATFWGLVVTVPALASHAIIRSRVDELTTQAEVQVERLLTPRRGRPAGAGSTGERAGVEE